MTDHERDDLEQALVILKRELARTEKRLEFYPLNAPDRDHQFLISKARRLLEAIQGIENLLKAP
jgi:hypothetical protein